MKQLEKFSSIDLYNSLSIRNIDISGEFYEAMKIKI